MKRRRLIPVLVTCLAVSAGCGPESTPPSSPAKDRDEATISEPEAPADASEDDETQADSTDDRQKVEEEARPVGPNQLPAALKEKNPGFSGEVRMQPISTELLAMAVQDSNLRDISPLAKQRIGVLDLSRCDITDLSPLEGMPITELYLEENRNLSDISALRGMPLQKLYLSNTRVENLGPLRGMQLEELNAVGTPVKDLSPLASCSIRMLWLTDCPVEDIAPLKKVLPLESLTLENTEVDDIRPLAGHPIQRLHIGRTEVTDLRPVAQMPQLMRLIFTPSKIEQGIDVVRSLPNLRELGTNFDNRMPPPQFWALYDEGKLE